MRRARKMLIYTALAILVILAVLFFSLGLHRKPRYVQNFEESAVKVKTQSEPHNGL